MATTTLENTIIKLDLNLPEAKPKIKPSYRCKACKGKLFTDDDSLLTCVNCGRPHDLERNLIKLTLGDPSLPKHEKTQENKTMKEITRLIRSVNYHESV